VTTASTHIHELPIVMASRAPAARLAELYERNYEAVFRAALRMTGNPADAEDVLQTVFLRVMARGDGLEGVELPAAYFRRAAVNAAVDVLRRRDVRAESAVDPGALQAAVEPSLLLKGCGVRSPSWTATTPACSCCDTSRGCRSRSWPGRSGWRRTRCPSGSIGSGTACKPKSNARRSAP
jgi:hypothetical protein